MTRVGQNHTYTVYLQYFWQGNHQIYSHIRFIYTVLANPTYDITCSTTRIRPTLVSGFYCASEQLRVPCLCVCHACECAMPVHVPCLCMCHVCACAMPVHVPCLCVCHACACAMSVRVPCLCVCHVCACAMSVRVPCLCVCHACACAMPCKWLTTSCFPQHIPGL